MGWVGEKRREEKDDVEKDDVEKDDVKRREDWGRGWIEKVNDNISRERIDEGDQTNRRKGSTRQEREAERDAERRSSAGTKRQTKGRAAQSSPSSKRNAPFLYHSHNKH